MVQLKPLIIEPTEEPKLEDAALKFEEKDTEEKSQPTACEPAMASDAVLPDLGYFHYLSQERTTLLEVFLINDLYSTTDDHKKIESLQQQYQHRIYDWIEIKILK
ncbi:hypothetical protein BHM03_00046657 [Ensete ventricosum]|uniref:Uncharacterized protein n=1 Tax=Ensete ventricosum TaxID=4639 RepID=A0A445ML37_ENSVE|nr:hypothetical protein BHM03_00046657 [Ensete ventricosum]